MGTFMSMRTFQSKYTIYLSSESERVPFSYISSNEDPLHESYISFQSCASSHSTWMSETRECLNKQQVRLLCFRLSSWWWGVLASGWTVELEWHLLLSLIWVSVEWVVTLFSIHLVRKEENCSTLLFMEREQEILVFIWVQI